MSRSEITLYNGLRKKLGNQESAELVDFVKSEVESGLKEKTNVFLTKEDKVEMIDRINVTTGKINETKIELIERINSTRSELVDRIDTTRSELIDKIDITKFELIERINKSKTETILWIVGVGIIQFGLTILSKKFL